MNNNNDRRITNVPIDAEDIVQRNLSICFSDKTYKTVHPHHRTKWEITKKENEEKLRRVIEEFPRDKPVEEQCSYWVRAISGIHPFQDANHRTATGTLRYILNKNGFDIDEWGDELMKEFVGQSKEAKEGPNGIEVTTENLHEEDKLFEIWKECFEKALK